MPGRRCSRPRMTRMGPSGLCGESCGACSEFPGTPAPPPQSQDSHIRTGWAPQALGSGLLWTEGPCCVGQGGTRAPGRVLLGSDRPSASCSIGTWPPPLSVLQEDPEPPHPTLAPESTGLAHPAEGPRLGEARPPPRGSRRLSLLRSRGSPPFPRPCCPRGSWTPSGAEGGSCARASTHVRSNTGTRCGHSATTQLAAGGWEGPGAGASCRYPLPPPSPASDPPAHPPPQVLSHRGSPLGCEGVGTEGESQRQPGAWREDSRSPGCTGTHAHTAALLGHSACTPAPRHTQATQIYTPTDTPRHTQPVCAQGVPRELPGGETEGAAGRLAQGPHSSLFPAPGQPGVRGASSRPWRGGACWERCWAGLGRGVSAANTPGVCGPAS